MFPLWLFSSWSNSSVLRSGNFLSETQNTKKVSWWWQRMKSVPSETTNLMRSCYWFNRLLSWALPRIESGLLCDQVSPRTQHVLWPMMISAQYRGPGSTHNTAKAHSLSDTFYIVWFPLTLTFQACTGHQNQRYNMDLTMKIIFSISGISYDSISTIVRIWQNQRGSGSELCLSQKSNVFISLIMFILCRILCEELLEGVGVVNISLHTPQWLLNFPYCWQQSPVSSPSDFSLSPLFLITSTLVQRR